MLANTLTLTKKSENSSAQFSRKTPNKWTNRKTDKWTKKGKKPTTYKTYLIESSFQWSSYGAKSYLSWESIFSGTIKCPSILKKVITLLLSQL